MTKRCLVTGCSGFLGSYLADLIVDKGFQLWGTTFQEETANIEHLQGKAQFLECDLKDRDLVEKVVKLSQPHYVFHLAAQSFVNVSWEDPEETLESNVLGSFYLLETLRQQGSNPVIEIVSSSAVYGVCSDSEMPLSEGHEFRPTSIYAVSKVTEDMLGYFYWKVYGLRIIRVRPFNMTGPRKTGDAVSDFARGIAEVEKGRKQVLEVGNLNGVRDFTDGRDATEALWLLAQYGEPGEVYNLCSGQERLMRSILEQLISMASCQVKWEVSSKKLRPYDDPIYVGDNSRLRQLGWEPRISFNQTLADSLEYWRKNQI